MLNSILPPLVAGLAFLQLAHAIPPSLTTRATTRYLATFNDIPVVDPALATQAINEYDEVFFRSFVLASAAVIGAVSSVPGVGGVAGSVPVNVGTGVTPHSPPRYAAFSVVTRTEQGTVSLTTVYADSPPTKRITLYPFWWSAVLRLQQDAATVPQNAQLTVTGFDANEKLVASAKFDYDFTGLNQQLVFAEVGDDFKDLKHVDFNVDAIFAGILISTQIDDVDFSVTK
ncbi:hypothetical protein MMC22_005786 [Lobaria immixta]|nr:hypothetical protein [Lobaria immixta]